jgi:Uma2 family endonuclease
MSIASDTWPRRHLINVEEYYRMAEAGVLAPDARVELIEGEIIDMPPIGSNHAGVVNFLMRKFVVGVGERSVVTVQQPLHLGDRSEPQPDLMLLKPRADIYRSSLPTAADVLLLVEVGDNTLRFDRGEKASLYARHEIAELWVVDLPHHQVHRLQEPAGGKYGASESLSAPALLAPSALPELRIDLSALFPEPIC